MCFGCATYSGRTAQAGLQSHSRRLPVYMARTDGCGPSGQRWGTFVRNHMPQIAAMDLFVIPTLGFNLLYVLVIVRLARRELVWINVTSHPTAEWIAEQRVGACSIAMTRDCFEPVSPFFGCSGLDGACGAAFAAFVLARADFDDGFFADFDIEILRSVHGGIAPHCRSPTSATGPAG
jgi:hypothetical protein